MYFKSFFFITIASLCNTWESNGHILYNIGKPYTDRGYFSFIILRQNLPGNIFKYTRGYSKIGRKGFDEEQGVFEKNPSDKESDASELGSCVVNNNVDNTSESNSKSIFDGDYYSLSTYGERLPDGCKTMLDFLHYPRNYDFSGAVKLALGMPDPFGTNYAPNSGSEKEVKAKEQTGSDFGPYPESAYDLILSECEEDERRLTTVDRKVDIMAVESMFDKLAGKGLEEICQPRDSEPPLSKIDKNYLMLDSYGYIKHYLLYLNQYNYKILSHHHKNTEKLNFYLNHEYIQEIKRPFPPPEKHLEHIRKYFLELLPTVMENLVDLIMSDPNKYNTPSPPFHDMSFAPGFEFPDYLSDGYVHEKPPTGYKLEDYEKFSSLKGLHDPKNHLFYPYANLEPLRQRQLLAIYLDIVNTKDLGPIHTYKKYNSETRKLRKEMFGTYTISPPITTLENDIKDDYKDSVQDTNYGGVENISLAVAGGGSTDSSDKFEIRPKVYELGKKKSGKALVYMEPGNGHIIINNRDGYQYMDYNEVRLREILEPLSSLYIYDKFNVVAKARGGGKSGQSVAIRHALVKYISRVLSPKLKTYLRACGLVSIDMRRVERKKTNLRKARKKEKYSKR